MYCVGCLGGGRSPRPHWLSLALSYLGCGARYAVGDRSNGLIKDPGSSSGTGSLYLITSAIIASLISMLNRKEKG